MTDQPVTTENVRQDLIALIATACKHAAKHVTVQNYDKAEAALNSAYRAADVYATLGARQ